MPIENKEKLVVIVMLMPVVLAQHDSKTYYRIVHFAEGQVYIIYIFIIFSIRLTVLRNFLSVPALSSIRREACVIADWPTPNRNPISLSFSPLYRWHRFSLTCRASFGSEDNTESTAFSIYCSTLGFFKSALTPGRSRSGAWCFKHRSRISATN